MPLDRYKEIAIKYRVEDLSGASIPGSRLSNILKQLELGEEPISNMTQAFFRNNGLLAILHYAKKEITYAEFLIAAEPEQAERRLGAGDRALKEQAARALKAEQQRLKADEQRAKDLTRLRQAKERYEAKKRAYDNDPRNIAKAKQAKLRRKYDLSYFIEKRYFPKLMDILRRVDNGVRLSEDEVVWLSTDGDEYYTQELREGFHKNEADFHAGEFKKNKDPWSAVNASSHYRKCNKAKVADSMLHTINLSILKNLKLKSALCTTHGGVKRDLMKYDEALELGEQAHRLSPKDFRPCTLLGAVNIEIGDFELGQSWFRKAVERGYSEKSVDYELRSIFMRAEKSKQDALRDHLLKIDPVRYSWAKKKSGKKTYQRR